MSMSDNKHNHATTLPTFTVVLNSTDSYYHNVSYFFFNDTATTEIYTLSLHDALPICDVFERYLAGEDPHHIERMWRRVRSEEHTSELQSQFHLVCRLLLEKKNTASNECDCRDRPSPFPSCLAALKP